MFSNLKSKIGDVTDLKKLSSPQTMSGSRQRSQQHTPGTVTPSSQHSRQPSIASLQGLGLPTSPPLSPTDHDRFTHGQEREHELEREVAKLRSALETQQDAALERLNAKEQEWKQRLQQEHDKHNSLTRDLDKATERERKLQEKIDSLTNTKRQTADQLKQAQVRMKGLEERVCEMQENNDQLEGLNAQEVAKIKHMLLNTNNELEEMRAELEKKTAALASAEARLSWAANLEERMATLGEEKTELETQVAGLSHKLTQANSRYDALEEARKEEVEHLRSRVSTLEHRHSQAALQETDKVQALIKEREGMEHNLEEARQQLNNIKASWSDKITSLETQIRHLNDKMAEDQSDLQAAEEQNRSLMSDISALKEENASLQLEKEMIESKLQADAARVKEDLETLQWQLNSTVSEKNEQIKSLQEKLSSEEERHQSCAGVLQVKLETVASLEQQLLDVETEKTEMWNTLTSIKEDLSRAQSEKNHFQETLHQERTTSEALEKSKSEYQAKLEVVSGEKAILSRNLDEYAERVTTLESSLEAMQQEDEAKGRHIIELEAKLESMEREFGTLRDQLDTSEEDMKHRIEESDTVRNLMEAVKNLEDELSEKKQTLKVQGQRLADMKKTIQRELKLTTDTPDSSVVTTTVTNTTTMASADPYHHGESRLSDATPPLLVANGETSLQGPTNTTNLENGNNVNLTYLKHVIIKYLTSREYEAVHLTRAVATLLMMTAEEERLLRETLEWKMSWFGPKPNLGKGQKALTIPPSQ
ncbi:hypothetical protein Pmani_031584 [Petrolisthes manimaculis]|uniref:GRIP domain-containing protein n=1 Tax=Petrolisthes manimaculis TaxID=1843537 RepID=A0AAE1TSH6_9EUCA|nr:hypothetical protein Pmani_031584 [Petrolisthes manimaculis]